MKKFMIGFALLALISIFTGCGSDGDSEPQSQSSIAQPLDTGSPANSSTTVRGETPEEIIEREQKITKLFQEVGFVIHNILEQKSSIFLFSGRNTAIKDSSYERERNFTKIFLNKCNNQDLDLLYKQHLNLEILFSKNMVKNKKVTKIMRKADAPIGVDVKWSCVRALKDFYEDAGKSAGLTSYTWKKAWVVE